MQDVILVILAKPVITLKLQSMNMWKKTKKPNIYKHLHNNEEFFSSFNPDCFSILDYTPTQFQIKIKEGMYINSEKPNLNKSLNHLATTLSI